MTDTTPHGRENSGVGNQGEPNSMCPTCGMDIVFYNHPQPCPQARPLPDALTVEKIKMFTSDPEVLDAIRNPADPFSMAWHKREDEHRRALAAAAQPLLDAQAEAKGCRSEISVVDRYLAWAPHMPECHSRHGNGDEICDCGLLDLRTSKPVTVSLEKGAAATYNDYFGGNDKWPDATDNERALYIDGTKAAAKAWGLLYAD